jgi:hypothetical protein
MSKEYQQKKKNFASLFSKVMLIKLVIQSFLGLGLLAGGITILALRIPGWSIIFGLPMVVISSVFIIYTYDDVLSKDFKIQDDVNAEMGSDTDNLTIDRSERRIPPNKLD